MDQLLSWTRATFEDGVNTSGFPPILLASRRSIYARLVCTIPQLGRLYAFMSMIWRSMDMNWCLDELVTSENFGP